MPFVNRKAKKGEFKYFGKKEGWVTGEEIKFQVSKARVTERLGRMGS